jgi:hypothetical protein
VPIKTAILLGRPGFLIAPFLKVGLAAVGQVIAPCRLERRTRSFETRGTSISLLTGPPARVKSAMPLPGLCGIRDTRALDDHADANAGIVDVPGDGPIIGAFAGEGGHAPLKRGLGAEEITGASNGDQVSRVAALAMKRGKSVDFTGYWQRHISD